MLFPLQQLTKNQASAHKISWNPEAEASFYEVKIKVSVQTKLFWYKEGEPINLLTNASDYGIVGYLYQLIDERKRPVAFVSKSLIGPQLRWSISQKEGYAIFHCITKLQYLLRDRFFRLLTYHRNLTFVNDSVNAIVVR